MNSVRFAKTTPSAVLAVRGNDAFTFLQGQFTNDLRSPRARPATYGLWLNAKGKVQADSFVLQRGPADFLLVSFSSAAEAIRARLDAFIIADDVELEDQTAQWTGVSVLGQGAHAVVQSALGAAPEAGEWSAVGDGLVFCGRGEPDAACECLVPAPAGEIATRLQATGGVEIDEAEFRRRRIRAGIPAVPADLGPGDLPQEGGLERDAVSFNKGCYLGQEVMARLHSMGQVRRTLAVLAGDGEPPALGAPIFARAKQVGEFRSAAAEGAGFVALVMIQRSALAAGAAPLSRAADQLVPLRVIAGVPADV